MHGWALLLQLGSISVNQLALDSFARREEECKSSLEKEQERLHRLDVDAQLRTLSAAAEADKHRIDQLRQVSVVESVTLSVPLQCTLSAAASAVFRANCGRYAK